MKNILRAILAGWGAKKLSGGKCGCFAIIAFLVLYWLLGFVFEMF